MVNSCKIPVTAKTRIGVDEIEDFEYLNSFINKICIIILCIFPEIVTWLPDKLMGKPIGF